jgi:SprT protein
MTVIQAIDQYYQRKVIAETQRYIAMAATLYSHSFAEIDVVFDLKGRTAGMYRCYRQQGWFTQKRRQIRFNPWLFAKYPEDSWSNTIPHEVAHYIADCRYGLQNIKPHGEEWRQIMRELGAVPSVRANYDLAGIPTRRIQRYGYQCACRAVELTIYRHKKVQQGVQQYVCRDCSQTLVFTG